MRFQLVGKMWWSDPDSDTLRDINEEIEAPSNHDAIVLARKRANEIHASEGRYSNGIEVRLYRHVWEAEWERAQSAQPAKKYRPAGFREKRLDTQTRAKQ